MTASVHSPMTAISLKTMPVSTTVARKRRRQILQSQRSNITGPDDVCPPKKRPHVIDSTVPTKGILEPGRNVHDSSSSVVPETTSETKTTTKTDLSKKSQMRYDPDVPMTKEEATAWRREQRRKRNRESAAASRQRQRDRINELEEEVEDWKVKFEKAMERLQKLEELQKKLSFSAPREVLSHPVNTGNSAVVDAASVSPCASPQSSPRPSPTLSSMPPRLVEGDLDQEDNMKPFVLGGRDEEHLIEIPRQAVKITGAHSSPTLLTLGDSALPDSCISQLQDKVTALVPLVDLPDEMPYALPSDGNGNTFDVPDILTSEESDVGSDDELQDFLLDAVQWL